MGDKNYRILLVEDCKRGMSEIYTNFLFSEYNNLHINLVTSVADIEHRLKTDSFSAVLLAPNLPNYDGTSLVNYIKKTIKGIPLVVFLDSSDEQRINDVKKIQVEKIVYDGNVDIKEIAELCKKSGNYVNPLSRKVVAPKFGQEITRDTSDSTVVSYRTGDDFAESKIDVQAEIKRHREALLKAREESENSKEAEIRAKNEAEKLREEALNAKNEAENIKRKVEELKLENTEKSKIIEENKQRVNSISQEVDTCKESYGQELDAVIQERDKLVVSLQNVQIELDDKKSVINHCNDELFNLRKEVDSLINEKNELSRRFDDSENKRNISLRDVQDALKSLETAENAAKIASERIAALEVKVDETIVQRDKALESARLAGEYSNTANQERNEALEREKNSLEAKLRAEKFAVELTSKLDDSEKMVGNLNKVVESLELRCEELEAGQAALIEAEHVGLQREREGREKAEAELNEVKNALVELEEIELERAKLEELLKEEQSKEHEHMQVKTRELEDILANERDNNIELQEKLNSIKGQMESKTKEIGLLVINNERYESELAQKDEILGVLEGRVLEYKNTLNELEVQHNEELKQYSDKLKISEEKVGNYCLAEEEMKLKIQSLIEEKEVILAEKKEIMESYANKAEAVQDRLNAAERMLKDCEWKLENETTLKDLALERVMELGAFEEQVGQLEIELEEKNKSIESMTTLVSVQKEELAQLKENEAVMKDRVQLENLEKDMVLDKIRAEFEALKQEYHEFREVAIQEKESIAANAQDVQNRLRESNEKLKNTQWEAQEACKEKARLVDRVGELESEVNLIGDLHLEVDELKDLLQKAEKKVLFLTEENEKLVDKISSYNGMAIKINELEEKAQLADKVALEIEGLNKALNQEQIEHRRLSVEVRKANERENHLQELKNSNKDLSWELMRARTLIGEYMAREEERAIEGGLFKEAEVEKLKSELKQKEELLETLIKDREVFTQEQLNKVAELTELYEKAQAERLELLEKLGRQQ